MREHHGVVDKFIGGTVNFASRIEGADHVYGRQVMRQRSDFWRSCLLGSDWDGTWRLDEK